MPSPTLTTQPGVILLCLKRVYGEYLLLIHQKYLKENFVTLYFPESYINACQEAIGPCWGNSIDKTLRIDFPNKDFYRYKTLYVSSKEEAIEIAKRVDLILESYHQSLTNTFAKEPQILYP
jgi:hypothetical protein